jgi:hypothetical protein
MAKKKKTERQDAPLVLRKRMPERKKPWFVLWHLFLLLIACAALTFFTLQLSYSNLNPEIWLGYWENLWIPLINFCLVLGLCLFLFALTGRAWLAWLLTVIVCLGVAVGNYYLIVIRTDPLQFQDLTCLREALAITGTQGYELELSPRILLAVGGSLGMTVLLALLSRWRPRWGFGRAIALVLAAAALYGASAWNISEEMWELTKHYDHINTWSVTEIYVSRGVISSFNRTIFTVSGKPNDYSEAAAEATLAQYVEEDIPDARKVDVFVIMRESYADLSELDCDADAIDFSCYDAYHAFRDEAVLWGNLVTNGFGGDTKNAERCFLTGNYSLREWRSPANSYVWYLKQQGYRTEGAHPFNGWFYNRLNVNRYLGFDSYLFRENCFDELVGEDVIANDDVLYEVIWEQYQTHLAESGAPYFNFSVTYEGHGPYSYMSNTYKTRFVKKEAGTPDGYAMNNYLGCCARRDGELAVLLDRFRASDRPIVLLTYGDHKATLGKDVNNYTTAAYSRYGMDLDLSTEEGFFNYYSTDYVIWMNDAARSLLGVTGNGPEAGPAISPCYLMNVLFDALGWGKGPAYLQAMDGMLEAFPVYSTKGRVSIDGALSTTIPGAWIEQYHLMQTLCYYWKTNFFYEEP